MYCPDCGKRTLRLIESTEPDGSGEFKNVATCDDCEIIVYVVRNTDSHDPNQDYDTDED